jgi:hypothetical protein
VCRKGEKMKEIIDEYIRKNSEDNYRLIKSRHGIHPDESFDSSAGIDTKIEYMRLVKIVNNFVIFEIKVNSKYDWVYSNRYIGCRTNLPYGSWFEIVYFHKGTLRFLLSTLSDYSDGKFGYLVKSGKEILTLPIHKEIIGLDLRPHRIRKVLVVFKTKRRDLKTEVRLNIGFE